MAIQKTFADQYPSIALSDLDDNFEQVDLSYAHANGAFDLANSAYSIANSANSIANSANTAANITKDYYSIYESTSTNIVSGAIVPFDTELKSSNSSVFSVSSGVVTINKTGTFLITADITTDVTSGSNRSDSYAEVRKNGSIVTGSTMWMYNRLSTEGATTGSSTIIVDVTETDNVSVYATRDSGTDTVVTKAAASRLTIMEL